MPKLGLAPLLAFGEEANRLELPCIAEGGFIILGREATLSLIQGKEESAHDERAEARAEVGRETGSSVGSPSGSREGSREGSPSEAAAARAPAHTLGAVTVADVLEELCDYGATATVAHRSSHFICVQLHVGLFRALPFRSELLLEVPLLPRAQLRRGLSQISPVVPDVRAWARWSTKQAVGDLIRNHHQYPDLAMCACMPNQWTLGRHPLIRYVDFCVVWIGKALHEQQFESYPGRQHYSAKVRVGRDRQDEYCGCGSARKYRDCCRESDRALSFIERVRRHQAGENAYLVELDAMGRSRTPPKFVAPNY